MFIRPSIVAAAEKRMPPELAASTRFTPALAAEALVGPAPSAPPPKPPTDTATAQRVANLAFGGAKPSTTELERLIGSNDLVDEFYLQRALVAARPVMRITLRDAAGRERGWATGFMVAPRLLLTNWHVFPSVDETTNAVAEAHYVLDFAGNPAPSYRFAVRGDLYYFSNVGLDFSLVAVDPIAQDGRTPLTQFGYHRLIAQPNKIREGECMTLVQHPGGERRQFAIRENKLVKLLDQFLWYESDTAPGSSGAPAFNDSFQVVALHHSGAAKRDPEDGRYVLRDGTKRDSLDGVDDSQVVWVANEGLRISVLCDYMRNHLPADNPYVRELVQAMQGGDVISAALAKDDPGTPVPGPESAAAPLALGGNGALTIPLQLQLSLTMGGVAPNGATAPAVSMSPPVAGAAPMAPVGVEALRYPIVDRDYASRTGYDANFLGVPAPVPTVTDLSRVSRMADGNYVIPYEHFSIVVDKTRRLPLWTASTVDYRLAKRRPEPGDYSRKGLTGLGKNDQEKWLTDPRLPEQDQLPDVFYTKDGGAFDKGHVVRREDICWGDSHDQIVRANGDTFHVTNCTPQVLGFNRSSEGEDNWGDLENEVQKQAKAEKLSVLAGPILAADDKTFEGKDDLGPVKIKIPREFWKVVLSNENGHLAAYAFVLHQDLRNVPEEFAVTATWAPYLVSLDYLETRLEGVVFPPELHAADRSSESGGQELAEAVGAGFHSSASAPRSSTAVSGNGREGVAAGELETDG